MSAQRTRDGYVIPGDMYQLVKTIKDKGGKVFWSFPPQFLNGCQNCHGTGDIMIQVVTGGPYDDPRSGPVKDHAGNVKYTESAHFRDGRWYKMRTHARPCPICNGSGQDQKIPEPRQRSVKDQVDRLARGMQEEQA